MVRTVIRIPTEMTELRERLNGIERLLFTRKWERAALVFAFTEVQTNKGPGNRPGVTPGKYNIRDFAALGIAGLTTNKAVSRYRNAWLSAVSQGWAPIVSPGVEVVLPDRDFPAWSPSVDDEVSTVTVREISDEVPDIRDYQPRNDPEPRPRRNTADRLLSHLDDAAKGIRELAEVFTTGELEPEVREAVVERLEELQRQTRAALKALRPVRSV